jgi:hypothetical protein
VLTPVSDEALDETNDNSAAAIDGNPATSWQTQFYRDNPVFGGLKGGSGLVIDMGRPVTLSSVTVTFGSIAGTDVQIRIGTPSGQLPPSSTTSQADMDFANAMTTVAQQTDVSNTVTFPVHSTAKGQYVLIWFTKLAPMQANSHQKYQADIFNVVVKGTSS